MASDFFKNIRKYNNEFKFCLLINLVIGIFLYIFKVDVLIIILTSLTFFIFSFRFAKVFTRPLNVWMMIAEYAGRLFNPLILSFIYLVLVIPTGIYVKLFNGSKGYHGFKKSKNYSYWVNNLKKCNFNKQY